MKRTTLILAVIACVAAAQPAFGAPAPTPPRPAGGPPAIGATAAILVDGKTGQVLFQKYPHLQLAPASLTKVVTALVVRDSYPLDEVVTVDPAASQVRSERIGLQGGQQLSVRELLYAMLLMSANDAAYALAAHDPQGVQGFLAKMNAKALALGANESHFANPHGLDEPGHVSSAWDMAIFAKRLLADPILAQIVSTKTYPVPWTNGPKVVQNHNKLLFRSYPGVVGVKTGYTNHAGNCLIAANVSDAGTAITVVLHSPNHYAETTALFDYFKSRPAIDAAAPVLPTPLPAPRVVHTRDAKVHAASAPLHAPRAGWVALPMSLLALGMLMTVRRRGHPLLEAAQFHHYLEPLVSTDEP